MKLSYAAQLSPNPIPLSVGTIRKPTLRELSELTFEKFDLYKIFISNSTNSFFELIKIDKDNKWNSLSEQGRENFTMYKILLEDEEIKNTYLEILNYFFIEDVIFAEGIFILLSDYDKENFNLNELKEDSIRGVIHEKIFGDVLNVLQQICCIETEDTDNTENIKFKNETARRYYEKMQKAKKERDKRKKKQSDKNLFLANIISAVSNKHPTINPINVWDLNLFQLIDSFKRLQINSSYEISALHVSVWGDEKKTFKDSLWYENNYDN